MMIRSECCKAAVTIDEQYKDASLIDGGVAMYSCKKCGNACPVEEGAPAEARMSKTAKENIRKLTETPMIRAFHHPTHAFVPLGMLDLQNRFYIRSFEGPIFPLVDVTIDFFTGRFAEDGRPIYQSDRVEMETKNQWGSLFKDTGTVEYDPHLMCYFITSDAYPDQDGPLPTKITRVIGHAHE
jgi:hypothetical protein